MRNTLIKFLLTIALLNISFTTNNLHAQGIIENIKFDQITNENGRSLGFITGIEQDSTGFLWFATRNGLIRYDGYSYTYFKQGKHSKHSLPFNNVTSIYYDRNKMLWLKHVDELYLFENQKISNRLDTILQNRFRHNTQVVQDIENNYWIGPHEQLLYKFNPINMEVDTFMCQTNQIKPNTSAQLKQNSKKEIYGTIIYQISISQSGFPLISTNKAIQEYNPKTKGFQIIEKIEVPDSMRNYIIIPVLETPDNTYVYAIQDKLFLKNSKNTYQINLQSVDKIMCVMSDYEKNLWIGTTNGLFIIDLSNSNIQQGVIHINSTPENQLYSDKIWNIFEDHSHNIWIGTDKGLNRYRKSKFNVINIDNEQFTTQPMATDNHGNIFLLTHQGKWTVVNKYKVEHSELPKSIFKYEQQTDKYSYDFNDLIMLDNQICYFAVDNKIGKMDKSGNLFRIRELYCAKTGDENIVIRIIPTNKGIWAATTEKMILFDHNLNIINQVNHPETRDDSYEMAKDFVKDVIWTGNTTLTIRTATKIYSLSTNDLKTNILYEIPQFSRGSTLSEGNLALDTNGCLWFVVFPQLICVTKKGELLETTIEIPEDIVNAKIIFVDSTMLIYSNNGLLKISDYSKFLNSKPEIITSEYYDFYTIQEGLADNLVTGIIAGKQNRIWVTTFKGLSHIDLSTGEIQNYFRDGDQSLGFPGNKVTRSDRHSKTAILQTTNGIMTFIPDSINPFTPNVVINELLLFGKEFETDSMLWNKKYIKLKYNQNSLTIGFSALDYTQPVRNKYRYRMENLNDEWIYTDANNRKAIFVGLPSGVYRFTVQGSNNDGLWNTKGQTIIIQITPPWWRTTVAYISYIVIAIVGVFAFMKIREQKFIAEKRILEEKVNERTYEIMMQNEKIQKQSDRIAKQHKRITDSIHYARRIQTALLPSEEHIQDVFPSHFVLWLPRDIVSGDFFWITNENDLTIAVAADCTGHGVPGAFMSMLGIAFLNELINKDGLFETDEILNRLRTNIIRSLKQTGEDYGTKDGMNISICAINHTTLTAHYSGAYQPLIIIRDGEILEYKADNMPIGYHIRKNETFTYQEIQLKLGDRLYMYSDGYIDQFGGKNDRRFTSRRLKDMLSEIQNLTMLEQKKHLTKTLKTWMGSREQVDDILVFGIEITGKFASEKIDNSILNEVIEHCN